MIHTIDGIIAAAKRRHHRCHRRGSRPRPARDRGGGGGSYARASPRPFWWDMWTRSASMLSALGENPADYEISRRRHRSGLRGQGRGAVRRG